MMLVVRDRTMAYHDRIVGRVHVEPASLDLAAECRHVRKRSGAWRRNVGGESGRAWR